MGLSLTVLNLAGSIALLLWGVHMVQTGVQRAFGPKLRTAFGSALSNRFRAFAAGLGATAILQSSTATGLMLTGFAAGGLVDLAPGLAVMLGANVGTTLIVQVFSFDVAQAAPLLILVGVMLFRRASGAPRDFGRVLIGLRPDVHGAARPCCRPSRPTRTGRRCGSSSGSSRPSRSSTWSSPRR